MPPQNEIIPHILESEFYPAARPLPSIPEPLVVPFILQTDHTPIPGTCDKSECVSSQISETLNPDVPEFIPTELTGNSNNNLPTATDESNGTKNEEQSVKTKETVSETTSSIITSISNHNSFMKEDNKVPATANSSTSKDQENGKSNSSDDDNWQQVIDIF